MRAVTLLLALVFASAARADFLPASFSADYEESFVSAATGKEKKSFGRVDYKFPRHIRFEVVSPDPSTFVSNPRNSWYYTPPFIEGEEGQVVLQQSDDLALTKFLDALKHGPKSNAAYSAEFAGPKLILKFTPVMRKDLGMDRAELTAKGEAAKASGLGEFQLLVLHHLDGKKVTLKFLGFRPGVAFGPEHFTFRIPPKTKVTRGK